MAPLSFYAYQSFTLQSHRRAIDAFYVMKHIILLLLSILVLSSCAKEAKQGQTDQREGEQIPSLSKSYLENRGKWIPSQKGKYLSLDTYSTNTQDFVDGGNKGEFAMKIGTVFHLVAENDLSYMLVGFIENVLENPTYVTIPNPISLDVITDNGKFENIGIDLASKTNLAFQIPDDGEITNAITRGSRITINVHFADGKVKTFDFNTSNHQDVLMNFINKQ